MGRRDEDTKYINNKIEAPSPIQSLHDQVDETGINPSTKNVLKTMKKIKQIHLAKTTFEYVAQKLPDSLDSTFQIKTQPTLESSIHNGR